MKFINAYSVARFGAPTVGIALSTHRYQNGGKQSPMISIGQSGLRLDGFNPCLVSRFGDLECVCYVELKTLLNSMTHRPFVVLKHPDTPPSYLVIFVEWISPINQAERIGHKLNLHRGVAGGSIVLQSVEEVVVQLPLGQELIVYYSDGAVRSFTAYADRLHESFIATQEQFTHRAVQARALVEHSQRPEEIIGLCRGMVDLLYLTTLHDHRGIGGLLRQVLFNQFFRYLPEPVMEGIRTELEGLGRNLKIARQVARLFPKV